MYILSIYHVSLCSPMFEKKIELLSVFFFFDAYSAISFYTISFSGQSLCLVLDLLKCFIEHVVGSSMYIIVMRLASGKSISSESSVYLASLSRTRSQSNYSLDHYRKKRGSHFTQEYWFVAFCQTFSLGYWS